MNRGTRRLHDDDRQRHVRLARLVAAAVIIVAAVGCGKRGSPLPPLRPVPGRIADAVARRIGDRVELRFTVPAANLDNSTPAAVTRIDIYAAPGPPAAPGSPVFPPAVISVVLPARPIPASRFPGVRLWPPATTPVASGKRATAGPVLTGAQLLNAAYLRGHVDIRPPQPPKDTTTPAPPAPTGPPDPRPAAGDAAAYSESVTKERAGATSVDASVLRYLVVPVAGRNRPGQPSSVLEVPLIPSPPPPRDVAISYDEHRMKMTWAGGDPAVVFRIYRADAAGKEEAKPLNDTALTVAAYETPVEFGVQRCFVVRSAIVRGAVSIESEAAAPACQTAVDTFPPLAPDGLLALPSEGKIQLKWNAVDAPDVAGYLVLRGEGAADLQPLTASPVADPSFDDTTPKPGVKYVYAVIAVDKAGNRSERSKPVEETAR